VRGDRLQQARERAGMTREELAEKVGKSYVTVGTWERGARKPKAEMLPVLASALNVSVDYLLGIDAEGGNRHRPFLCSRCISNNASCRRFIGGYCVYTVPCVACFVTTWTPNGHRPQAGKKKKPRTSRGDWECPLPFQESGYLSPTTSIAFHFSCSPPRIPGPNIARRSEDPSVLDGSGDTLPSHPVSL